LAAEIIYDDDVARHEGGHEELLDIAGEAMAVDWAIEDEGRVDWIRKLMAKKPFRPVSAALANKLPRIAWVLAV